ncbi:MAG TPA: hypothetical protein VMY35_08180 [Phycisphaerae bacterium]|nr:hypothetical protein [Phycisphaerae bacterium]
MQNPESTPLNHARLAGTQSALVELGLADYEKVAFLGALARLGLGGAAKAGVGTAAKASGKKGLMSGLSWLNTQASKPLAAIGRRTMRQLGQYSPRAAGIGSRLGKGMASDMVGFGTFTGGIEAAMADPGERMKAFGKGFGSGALMGGAWAGGRNAARMGLRKAMGSGGAARLADLQRFGLTGGYKAGLGKGGVPLTKAQRALRGLKGTGTALGLGGSAFAASDIAGAPFGQSMLLNRPETPKTFYQYPQTYGPMIAGHGLRPTVGYPNVPQLGQLRSQGYPWQR